MTDRGRSPDHLAFLNSLRPSRRFLDRDVPQDVIETLLAAAREIAGDDVAAWQFMVVDDLAGRLSLAGAGTFSDVLASTPAVIVVLHEGVETPSKANMEGRIADGIMRAAGEHGLAGGVGWFGTAEAQAEARAILGVRDARQVCAAVGVGYVDAANAAESSLQRARRALDRLVDHGTPRPPEGKGR